MCLPSGMQGEREVIVAGNVADIAGTVPSQPFITSLADADMLICCFASVIGLLTDCWMTISIADYILVFENFLDILLEIKLPAEIINKRNT